jgi:hypothetical protein
LITHKHVVSFGLGVSYSGFSGGPVSKVFMLSQSGGSGVRRIEATVHQDATPDDLNWGALLEVHRVHNVNTGAASNYTFNPIDLRDRSTSVSTYTGNAAFLGSPSSPATPIPYNDDGVMAAYYISPKAPQAVDVPFAWLEVLGGYSSDSNHGLGFFATFDSGFSGELYVNVWFEE